MIKNSQKKIVYASNNQKAAFEGVAKINFQFFYLMTHLTAHTRPNSVLLGGGREEGVEGGGIEGRGEGGERETLQWQYFVPNIL